MGHMTQKDWDAHSKAINEYHDDANQQEIIFRRNVVNVSKNGEDNNVRYKDTTILGLVQYNYFRSWPVTQFTDSGDIDKESCMVYLNLKYLKGIGLTNEHNQFLFDQSLDRFVIEGVTYKPGGESQVAQASDVSLLFYIILKREKVETSENNYL